MPQKPAKKTAKKAASKTAGNLTPKRTLGPHDGPPLPDPIPPKGSGSKPATAAKPNAIDGFMNFPPPVARPAPKK